MGAFGRFFMGTPGHNERVSTMTGQQQQLGNQLAQQGMQNTDFSGIENLETKRFNEQTIPSIAARFYSQGQNQNSSGYMGALGQAGADLGAQLAALRSQYGLQQSELGMTPQFENQYHQGNEGFLSQIAGPAAQLAMNYATGGLAGAGALGRGMMDQYRGRPSGSAYRNLFGKNQLTQQGGGLRPGYATPSYKTGAMTPMNQLPPDPAYANFFNQNQNNQTPWKPGMRQLGRPGAFGANPLLNQLLSRQTNPGVGNNIPVGNWQQPQYNENQDPSAWNALGRGLSSLGRGIGNVVGSAAYGMGQIIPDEDMYRPY